MTSLVIAWPAQRCVSILFNQFRPSSRSVALGWPRLRWLRGQLRYGGYWRYGGTPRQSSGVGQICVIFDTREYQTISSDDYVNLMIMTCWCRQKFAWLGNLSQNPQKRYCYTYIHLLFYWFYTAIANEHTGNLLARPNACLPIQPTKVLGGPWNITPCNAPPPMRGRGSRGSASHFRDRTHAWCCTVLCNFLAWNISSLVSSVASVADVVDYHLKFTL